MNQVLLKYLFLVFFGGLDLNDPLVQLNFIILILLNLICKVLAFFLKLQINNSNIYINELELLDFIIGSTTRNTY